MPDDIFLEILVMCRFQVRLLSMYTPRDFVNSTCFIESPFIEKDKGPLKVLNLCLDPRLAPSRPRVNDSERVTQSQPRPEKKKNLTVARKKKKLKVL